MKLRIKPVSILTICVVLLLTSCASFKVINLQNVNTIEKNELVYALPRTVIAVDVDMSENIIIAGPYAQYATKLLSIENVPLNDTTTYEISDIRLTGVAEPDPKNLYLIKTFGFYSPIKNLNLTETGIIKSINSNDASYQHFIDTFGMSYINSAKHLLTDVTVQDNLYFDRQKNVNRKAKRDTTNNKTKPTNVQVGAKSLVEKAEEAAEFILEIRQNRFKLLSGKSDKNFDAPSLKIALDELNQLEKSYLELFVGKNVGKVRTYRFTYIPEGTNDVTKNILFRFSAELGFRKSTDTLGVPYYIEVHKNARIKGLEDFFSSQTDIRRITGSEATQKGIFYRLPNEADVIISSNNHIEAMQTIPVAQLGQVMALPKKYLNSKKTQIEFYPELGSIKNISQKRQHHKK